MKNRFIRCFSNQINFFNKKTCVNCSNFKDFQPLKNYDPDLKEFGSCKVFSEESLVTGQIYHILAWVCRKDEKKCGKNAKYFIDKFHNKYPV